MKSVTKYFITPPMRRWGGKAFGAVADHAVLIVVGIVGAVMILAIGAAAVEAAKPVSGTVTEKIHTPDRSGYTYGYNCNSGKCENGYYYNSDPESWTLVIKDCTRECEYKSRSVDANTYYSHKVGDQYNSESN